MRNKHKVSIWTLRRQWWSFLVLFAFSICICKIDCKNQSLIEGEYNDGGVEAFVEFKFKTEPIKGGFFIYSTFLVDRVKKLNA